MTSPVMILHTRKTKQAHPHLRYFLIMTGDLVELFGYSVLETRLIADLRQWNHIVLYHCFCNLGSLILEQIIQPTPFPRSRGFTEKKPGIETQVFILPTEDRDRRDPTIQYRMPKPERKRFTEKKRKKNAPLRYHFQVLR